MIILLEPANSERLKGRWNEFRRLDVWDQCHDDIMRGAGKKTHLLVMQVVGCIIEGNAILNEI